MSRADFESIVGQQSRVIAAGLIAELVHQPDGDAMIAQAMQVFHQGVCNGIHRLIAKLEDRFEFDFEGVLGIAGGEREWRRNTACAVRLETIGPSKINVIKVVRAATHLGLKEAKDLVETAPVNVLTGMAWDDAEKLRRELEEAGATASI